MSRYGSGTLKQAIFDDIKYEQNLYDANDLEVIAALAEILADLANEIKEETT